MASNRAILLLRLSAILFFLSLSTASGRVPLQQKTDCMNQCAQEYREMWKVKLCQIKCPHRKNEAASGFYSISEAKDAQACRRECSGRGLDEPQRRQCERECRHDHGGSEELYTGSNNQRHCRMECSRKRGSKQEQYECRRRCEEQRRQEHGDNGGKYHDGNDDVHNAAHGFHSIFKAEDRESCRRECSGRGLDEHQRRRCERDCRREHDGSTDEKMFAGGSQPRDCSMECKRRGGSKQEQYECWRRCEEQRKRELGDNAQKHQDGTGGTSDKAAMGFYSVVKGKDPERCRRECSGRGLDEHQRRRCERDCRREHDGSTDEKMYAGGSQPRDCSMECKRRGGSKQEQYECWRRCEEQRKRELGDNAQKHQDGTGGTGDKAALGFYSIIMAKDPERCRRECSGRGLDKHQRRRCERDCRREHDRSTGEKSYASVNHHMDCRMECSKKGGSKQEQYECWRLCEEERRRGHGDDGQVDGNGDANSIMFEADDGSKRHEKCFDECQEFLFSKQECRKWCKIHERRLEAGEEEEESDQRMEKECRKRCLCRCQELGRCDCHICYKAGRGTSGGRAKW